MVANNRLHPRVKTQLPAILESEEHEALQLITDNISMSGVMLSVNRKQFLSILGSNDPQFAPNKPGTRESTLLLNLPSTGKGRSLKLSSRCRAIHVRRISQDKYLVGLKFTEFSGDGATRLKAFIDQAIKSLG